MGYATIRQGSKGEDVKVWQRIIGVTADGQFGSGTATATKNWQKSHGLTADGVVGPATWAAALGQTVIQTADAVAQVAAAAVPTATPIAVPTALVATGVSASTRPTLRQGSTGDYVKQWQNLIGVKADGQFGAATTAATKTWQAAHKLTADGIVGPASWNAALQQSTGLTANMASVPTVNPIVQVSNSSATQTIKKGSTGAAVREWQTLIGAKPVDGVFGSGTETATKNWQKAHGLPADGIVGPVTWAAARAAGAIQAVAPTVAPVVQAVQQAATQAVQQASEPPVFTSPIPGVSAPAPTPIYVPEPTPTPVTTLQSISSGLGSMLGISSPTAAVSPTFVQSNQTTVKPQPKPQSSSTQQLPSLQASIPLGNGMMANVSAGQIQQTSKPNWERVGMVGGGVAALGIIGYLLLRSPKKKVNPKQDEPKQG